MTDATGSARAAKPRPVSQEDVQHWDNWPAATFAELSSNPLMLEFYCKELGSRMVGRAEIAPIFSRRLFIDFCNAVRDAYCDILERSEDTGPDTTSAREKFSRISQLAYDLHEELNSLYRNQLAALQWTLGSGPKSAGNWRFDLPQLQDLLKLLGKDAAHTSGAISGLVKPGAVRSPLTCLIHRIARVLTVRGLPVNGKASGALHGLCRIALEVPFLATHFGEPRDLPRSIRQALTRQSRDTSAFDFALLFPE